MRDPPGSGLQVNSAQAYMERKKHLPQEQIKKLPTLSRFQITFFWRKQLEKNTILCSQALAFLKITFLTFLLFWKFENGKPMPRSFLTFTENWNFQCFLSFSIFYNQIVKAIYVKFYENKKLKSSKRLRVQPENYFRNKNKNSIKAFLLWKK